MVSKSLSNGREFTSMDMSLNGEEVAGMADGIRADVDGNIWSSAGWVGDGYDGVQVFAPDGVRIGQILLPEICSNVCFGGTKRNRLFMTGSTSHLCRLCGNHRRPHRLGAKIRFPTRMKGCSVSFFFAFAHESLSVSSILVGPVDRCDRPFDSRR